MSDSVAFRRRLAAAGVDLPEALLDMLAHSIGPMIGELDELAGVDLGLTEPFDPARSLVADAAR